MRRLVICFVLLSVACCSGSALAAKQATPEAVAWFQDAKFGLFVHWGVSTIQGDDRVYLHVLAVPADGKLVLGAPPEGIKGVATLDGKALPDAKIHDDQLVIPIPEDVRDDVDTVLVLTLP
jgi:hypothetical protein